MTREQLTAILAERVMGWSVAPDRFLLGNRRWIPRWRFQPFTSLDDAFQVLDGAASNYSLTATAGSVFTAKVRVKGRVGTASGEVKASTIALAVARAMGLEAPDATAGAENR